MRRGLPFLTFLLSGSLCAAASADAVATRADVLRDGHGSWTIDEGGLLGPIEVSMTRTSSGWNVTLHGMYPIMDGGGTVYGIASKIRFWLTDDINGQTVNLNDTLQSHSGKWNPGDTFDATFQVARKPFEDHPHIGLHVSLGDDRGSLSSARLEPRP